MIKEAYRKLQKASRKPQGSFKNFQGRNPYNIFVSFLVETVIPKNILKLTELYHSRIFIQDNLEISNKLSFVFPSFVYLLATKPITKWSRASGFWPVIRSLG